MCIRDSSPIEPVHQQYQGLKYRLQRYFEVEAEGHLDTFAFRKSAFAMGDSLPEYCELRHRLFQLGDLWVDSIAYTLSLIHI